MLDEDVAAPSKPVSVTEKQAERDREGGDISDEDEVDDTALAALVTVCSSGIAALPVTGVAGDFGLTVSAAASTEETVEVDVITDMGFVVEVIPTGS